MNTSNNFKKLSPELQEEINKFYSHCGILIGFNLIMILIGASILTFDLQKHSWISIAFLFAAAISFFLCLVLSYWFWSLQKKKKRELENLKSNGNG